MPDTDPQIVIERHPGRVVVTFNGQTIADTTRAVVLRARATPPVPYIPRDDVDMARLERTSLTTHCPYKGDAAYYSIRAGGRVSDNAVWTYESPLPSMRAIEGYLAFYPDRVDAIDERPSKEAMG